jgi:hypothetical protein
VTERLEQVKVWLAHLGAGGAVANAHGELERRVVEHAMLESFLGRVPAVRPREAEAA